MFKPLACKMGGSGPPLGRLGMSTYGGYWKDDPEGIPPNNFDSFGYAFFTQFQVLTMENWQSVMFVQMRNNKTIVQSF